MMKLKMIEHKFACALALICTAAMPALTNAADKSAPPTRVSPTTDTYWQVKVQDPYRWLENGEDPKVQQWGAKQNTRARAYLDKLPMRKAIHDQLMRDAAASKVDITGLKVAGDKVFADYSEPPKQQPMIAVLDIKANPETLRVVVDPNQINPKGTTAIDWFAPSPQGNLVAVSMSENGSEDGSLHLFDVQTGKEIEPVIPRVQYPTAGGAVAWHADGKGFWYTRYPGPEQPAERQHYYQQLYFHKLGDDYRNDALVIGPGLPKIAEISLDSKQNRDYVIVSVANGDGGEFCHFVIFKDGSVRQVTRFEDEIVAVVIGPNEAMYLTSRKNAPRGKLLKIPSLKDLALAKAQVIVPESDAVLTTGGHIFGAPILVTKSAIYLRQLIGGPSKLAIYGHDGTPKGEVPVRPISSVEEVVAMPDGSVLYQVAEFTKPIYYSKFTESDGKAELTPIVQTSPVRFDDVEVLREFAVSKDGTSIPINIVRKKGTKLDGNNPTLLYGYGGFGLSQKPSFLGTAVRMFLDAGGVYAVVNTRGGNEFGEEWHKQGYRLKKQNVFDDFAAAAQFMIEKGYTNSQRLAIRGGSNGGLLMGAEITQHPTMFRAVVAEVGIYDMLRLEADANGEFNATEYGSVKQRDQFQALMRYSPYHHVRTGVRYPAVLMQTGETDGRVNPMHSRKMVARLQAATASKHPIYLALEMDAGHGMGSALDIAMGQEADANAFLFDQLGMKFVPRLEQ